MAELYRYVPHHRTQHAVAGHRSGPVRVVDQLPRGSGTARFNSRAGLLITVVVGTMWCGCLFAILDKIGAQAG
jgi:hypothetical protein